jgi:hypothetical protein
MIAFLYRTDTNPHIHADKLHRLPKSLSESLEALRKDSVLTDLVIPGPKKNIYIYNKTRGFTFRVNLVILTVRVSNIYTLD